ncbi:TetR/AcrR family transcriptional regulator [Methylocapsa sp. S129]|uniref:TetR/AcrR family transcriptional regulator n=1 Tax=Methylocapsa sp. S129 TaxID=1641869 RepID=UPI00131D413D|nr:TetR/AcrR family transcriptional regulator [Methylocapsa sp. S129]
MMQRVRLAFLNFGYGQLTMGGLAKACDLTARALYYHFKSKEDAFRESIRWNHIGEIQRGWDAGRRKLARGGSAVEVIVAILDARFGETRRDLALSPHASELNFEAFHRCMDIIAQSAVVFQAGLAEVLADLEKRHLIQLRPNQTPADAAQLLADGARGVNQTLPNLPAATLPERYARMCDALLYGITEPAAKASRQAAARGDAPTDRASAESLLTSEKRASADGRR